MTLQENTGATYQPCYALRLFKKHSDATHAYIGATSCSFGRRGTLYIIQYSFVHVT
jgi:hypothetical protein